MKSTWKNLWAVVFLLAGLSALAWGLYPLLAPQRVFTRIKVAREAASADGRKALHGYNFDLPSPEEVASEVEFIRSEAILSRAIRDLNLDAEWSKREGRTLAPGEAVGLLQQRVSVRRVKKTLLVDIAVAGDDRAESARIADAIADAYHAHRHERPKEMVSQTVSGSIDTLQADLNRLGEQIYETRVSMAKLRHEAGISESDPASMIADPEKLRTYQQLKQKLANLTAERMTIEESFTAPNTSKAASLISVEILRRASSQPSPESSRHMGSMTLILAGAVLCGAGAILLIPFRKQLSPVPASRGR